MVTKLKKRPKELKGLKFTMKRVDKGYFYSKYELFEKDGIVYIKGSGYTMDTQWYEIKNIREHNMFELIEKSFGHSRHINDLLLSYYYQNNYSIHGIEYFKNL